MTGIIQSHSRPGIAGRPKDGLRYYASEEAAIMSMLREAEVEETIERLWEHQSPAQIASHIRSRVFHWITARWVEAIKRRIDNRKRRD